jgi:hypothetical protein
MTRRVAANEPSRVTNVARARCQFLQIERRCLIKECAAEHTRRTRMLCVALFERDLRGVSYVRKVGGRACL